jgi:hypothetical protein
LLSDATDYAEVLREEARRCERISLGISDPALARQLLLWAEEYRARSQALGSVLTDIIGSIDDPHERINKAA